MDRTSRALLLLAAFAAGCQSTEPGDSGSESGEHPEMAVKAEAPSRVPVSEKYTLPGFAVYEEGGRLWVFRNGSEALEDFLAKGEPAKRVTLIGAGPDGRTLMGAEREALDDFVLSRNYRLAGFQTIADDGRLWVFRTGSESLNDFEAKGEPAKRVTLIGAGPDGRSLMGAERETLEAYAAPWKYGREGFEIIGDEGRLWVFRTGSESLSDFRAKGEPAKRVTLIGAGPDGRTVMGPERETLDLYLVVCRYDDDRFEVIADDGRLWVFREESAALHDFRTKGEPAKRVTLIGAGPNGMTVMGADRETLDDFLAPIRYAQPGFVVIGDEGRLWIFREGTAAHREFVTKGEPAKRVTLIGAGPDGKTLLGADRDDLEAYVAPVRYGRPGFVVMSEDGRLWVFREQSAALADFRAKGEPAKRVTLIGGGPDGKTIMGADRETLDAYLRAGGTQ